MDGGIKPKAIEEYSKNAMARLSIYRFLLPLARIITKQHRNDNNFLIYPKVIVKLL